MTKEQQIAKVVNRHGLHEKSRDLAYWKTQTPEARIRTLEDIRFEYHQWRYGAQPRLQRVYTVVKRK